MRVRQINENELSSKPNDDDDNAAAASTNYSEKYIDDGYEEYRTTPEHRKNYDRQMSNETDEKKMFFFAYCGLATFCEHK